MASKFELRGYSKLTMVTTEFKGLIINDPTFDQYGEWHETLKGEKPTTPQLFWLESTLVKGDIETLSTEERVELIHITQGVMNVGSCKLHEMTQEEEDEMIFIPKGRFGNGDTKQVMNFEYYVAKCMTKFNMSYDEIMDASFHRYQKLLDGIATMELEEDLRAYHIAKTPGTMKSQEGIKSFNEMTKSMSKEIEKRRMKTVVLNADLSALTGLIGGMK